MNTQISFLRSATLRRATALTLVALAAAQAHAAQNSVTMTVDDVAPLQATLLPTVSITGDSANPYAEPRMSIAATAPLGVTLLPTVHVTAPTAQLAAVTLPVVRVFAHAETAPATDAVAYRVNDETGSSRLRRAEGAMMIERELPLRERVMPR
ncbi:MAG: hypothetical protein ABI843_09910 [Dokdonella sp.]